MIRLGREARRALRWATRHDPVEPKKPKRRRRRYFPMEWPVGSLYARQIWLLKWLESRGHEVIYD